jgi:hypothetical protein
MMDYGPYEEILGYKATSEHAGEYVRKIAAMLTLEDLEVARRKATRTCYDSDRAWTVLCAVHNVACEIDMMRGLSHGCLAHWMGLGIEHLTGTMVSLAEFKTSIYHSSKAPYADFEGLRAIVEEAIREAAEEECPWDDENAAVTRAFMFQTPYQMWLMVSTVEELSLDLLREALFDIAREQSDGRTLARNVQTEYIKAVDAWRADWKRFQ